MAGRPLMLATLLGASIGVPYVVSNTSKGPASPGPNPTSQSFQASTAPTAAKPSWPSFGFGGTSTPTANPIPPPLAGRHFAAPTTPVPAEPVRYHSISEVFRFDVSKEWIYQNWDRKSTGLGDPEMFGIRVALVTGTRMTDLAGSLTYFFDGHGRVQHISFRGRTADTTPLVQFLTQTYQFQRMEALPGEQLYQVRSGKSVYSELRTRPESVLMETTPHGSFGVVLELGRPGSNRVLTPPAPHLQIPEVASATRPAENAANAASDSAAGENGPVEPALIGKVRPATEAEQTPMRAHRWPN